MIFSPMATNVYGIKCKNERENWVHHSTLLISNAILDHYKKISDLKDGLDDFVPEEVIKYVSCTSVYATVSFFRI